VNDRDLWGYFWFVVAFLTMATVVTLFGVLWGTGGLD
jgi:hypothetical protein